MISSIKRIARDAGVSKTTVSLIINGKARDYRISDSTQARVMAAIAKRRFTPSEFARSFRRQNARVVGLVVGDITNPFFSLIAKGVESAARASGYHLIIASSSENPERETEVARNLLSHFVDGLIIASVHQRHAMLARLNARKRPLVYVDRRVKGAPACIVSDNAASVETLMRCWLKKGLRRIAFIGGDSSLATHRDRLAGYKKALAAASIKANSSLIFEGDFTSASGRASAEKLLSSNIPIDAVFFAAFTLFMGGYAVLKEHSPAIKFGTFDNHPLLDMLDHDVDTIEQNCEHIGKLAFESFMLLAEGKNVKPIQIVPATLIKRYGD